MTGIPRGRCSFALLPVQTRETDSWQNGATRACDCESSAGASARLRGSEVCGKIRSTRLRASLQVVRLQVREGSRVKTFCHETKHHESVKALQRERVLYSTSEIEVLILWTNTCMRGKPPGPGLQPLPRRHAQPLLAQTSAAERVHVLHVASASVVRPGPRLEGRRRIGRQRGRCEW